MPTINSVTCADAYTEQGGATLSGVWNPTGGWFSVSGSPVFVQLQYPIESGSGYGQAEWTDEQELGVGAFGTVPDGCTGIRFRNAQAGSNATVSATIAQGNEPSLAISALGSISLEGAPMITQQVFAGAQVNVYHTPATCKAILVEVIAGGGGGGGAVATGVGQGAIGGGGGGSAYAARLIVGPFNFGNLDGLFNILVGAGGIAGNGGTGAAGGNGGISRFGSIGQAGVQTQADPGRGGTTGGGGAPPLNGAVEGVGGTVAASVGVILLPGQDGEWAPLVVAATARATRGGMAARGGGGGPGGLTAGSNGNPAEDPGGGGGGGANGASHAAVNGGTGGDGLIVVTEFY